MTTADAEDFARHFHSPLNRIKMRVTEDASTNDVDQAPVCHRSADDRAGSTRQLTLSFLRLANLDSGVFDRLNRYEVRLWRQTVQILFALQPIKLRS